eukprot:1303128-Pleurochrysis_carterae.AAC.1
MSSFEGSSDAQSPKAVQMSSFEGSSDEQFRRQFGAETEFCLWRSWRRPVRSSSVRIARTSFGLSSIQVCVYRLSTLLAKRVRHRVEAKIP